VEYLKENCLDRGKINCLNNLIMNKNKFFVGCLILVSLALLTGCGNNAGSTATNTTSSSSNSSIATTNPEASQTFHTLAQVNQHAAENDCWMAISGKVYNVTDYIASGMHNPKIIQGCGIDATDLFNQNPKHQGANTQDNLSQMYIGNLKN